MKNLDNKTVRLDTNLLVFNEILEKYPIHIATTNKHNNPNLAVASDIKLLDEKTLLISNNEMINTPDNIKLNKNVVITCFDENWKGCRIYGTAKYYDKGKYFDLVTKLFLTEGVTPKGAIVVKVCKVEGLA